MSTYWLAELRQKILMENAFYTQMHEQLSQSFQQVIEESIENFVLIPFPNDEFQLVQDGDLSYLNAYLLNIDIIFPVSINWQSSSQGYMFQWLELPVSDIRRALAARRKIELQGEFDFEVTFRSPVWPHVQVFFYVEDDFSPDRVEQRIYDLIESWNQNLSEGVIHNAGPLIPLEFPTFSINIDFGSTGPSFLSYFLVGLNSYSITRIVFDTPIQQDIPLT